MLESTESLLPKASGASGNKSLRVVSMGETAESLDELGRLLTTLGVELVDRILVVHKKVHPATFVGKGKLEEAKALMDAKDCDAFIIDFDLSPNQLRNVEKVIGKPVMDRSGVIIEIFSRHARTKEAKTQVELAKLQYLLPRLAHFWTHFERQRGGGTGMRGMGEKQIEVDRRLVKTRMSILRSRLAEIEKERKIKRSSRKEVLKVALVGYTNAGKSTLLNRLTDSQVRAEDKLFATLDPSVRSLDPHCHPPIVAIDTVGFISRLPHALVASFRSTLEELHEADLLLHVVDGSSPEARAQYDVTETVLKDLGLEKKPKVTVLNKSDLVQGVGNRLGLKLVVPGAAVLSAMNDSDIQKLKKIIQDHFHGQLEVYEIVIPYDQSKVEALIHAHGAIEVQRHLEKGTFFRVRMEQGWAKKLGLEKYRT
ncbi:MAG: GTPase HflX [Bdellovibrionales bacterium]|nr:GTPase HflX [Bdellovibrionales bacterium]